MSGDLLVFEEIKKLSESSNKKLTDVNIERLERNSDVLFVLLPQWAAALPPYNIARLSALVNEAGYKSSCLDVNVETYQESKKWHKELGFDPYGGNNYQKWQIEEYQKYLHKYVKPILQKYIDIIIKINPKVIGITLYFCNEGAVQWFVSELRKKLPNTKIFGGGPNLHFRKDDIKKGLIYCDDDGKPLFDYGIVGESELIILDVLDEIEKGKTHKGMKIMTQPITQRINLNNFPIPNYEDFDFNKYEIGDGALTELSRGCVAKCTFCAETHFWNYRQRNASSVLDEVEYLYNKGTRLIWFVDSLVNGNLKELKGFAQGVIDRGLKIKWIGYARCDKRMDYEYLKVLKDSGCFGLKFGAESASNKVLDDMKKRVTNVEMEENFIDCKKLGIQVITTWIQAFPTETSNNFLETLTFINNTQDTIHRISSTPGYQLTAETIVGQNFERFGLSNFTYDKNWIKDDFSFGKPHILTRAKLFDIFVKEFTNIQTPDRPLLSKMYDIKYNKKISKKIKYFDKKLNMLKFGSNKFKSNLIMEPFYFFYFLWKVKGGFEMNLKFDEELDYKEFGYSVKTPYWANFWFKINDNGDWETKVDAKYLQPENPFSVLDFSQKKSQVIERVRVFAEPKWGDGSRTEDEIKELQKEEKHLNNTQNFSFNFDWEGKGTWDEKKKTLF